MQFMCDNAPAVADDIRAVYIESMGRTILALFRAYHAQLMKLELEVANRHDLIAVEVSIPSRGACASPCVADFDGYTLLSENPHKTVQRPVTPRRSHSP